LRDVNSGKSVEDSRIDRIGPYRVEEPIGNGGMGTVWRAWDERLRRQVAIKRIHPESVSHPRERLRREAQAAARLNHSAIVHVYDLVESGDGDWIVMELVQGRTLRRVLDEEGPLSFYRAAKLGGEIAEGLAEAHSRGILHRDLKASNVMVTPAGGAKILDFGLAKELPGEEGFAGPEASLSVPGTILGTCHAMSPEQVMGLDLDARSDLFSLGSLLYEALVGEAPFRGESPRESLARVLSLRPRPLWQVRPGIPRELSDLVERLLEKDPGDRPRSAEEAAEALSALTALLGSEGPAPGSGERRLGRSVERLSRTTGSAEATIVEGPARGSPSSASPSVPRSDAFRQMIGERRRLTVVCCGLVSADDASEETHVLEIEALSEAMAVIQDLVREVGGQLGGHLGAVLGGLLWLYFGYPQAQEDEAQRAVRAARALAERVEKLGIHLGGGGGRRLALRIGVHSGPAVVLARPNGGEELQLGSTLDVATGLQNLAPLRGIVVSEATRRLLGRSFTLGALAPAHLPGFQQPVPMYRILEEVDQRREDSGEVTPLVGRDREVELLLDRFRLSRAGTGQAVLICGEAGIGKSRLVRALREGLAAENPAWLVGYGSPYTQSSPLSPMIDLLERSFLGPAGGSPEQKLLRLEDLLRRHGAPLAESVPLLATLLSLPAAGRYPLLTITPDVRREKTLEILVALLAEMAERQPMVLVMEDLHWIDPSTLELLDLLLDEITALPLMLVATFRPQFQPPWRHRADVTQISLSRLTDGETEALISRLAEGKDLPPGMRRQIVAKTDGVPLFVEELTKAVLETGWTAEQPDIPSTLDGSLMARLDRLGEAKEVAQLASVIGRVFTFDLLAAISRHEEAFLRRGLEELLQAELVHRRGLAPRTRYVFKHALIQDAAYLSLLRSQRQQIHQRIALVLEEEFSNTRETEPEILAYHFERAGMIARAITYLQHAALRATQRSAFSEALSHCGKGIELLASLPPSPQRSDEELALRSTLGVALIPTRGYASKEVEENAARCQALCHELGNAPRLIPSLYGLWVYHLLRGHRRDSRELAEEIGRLAREGEENVFIGFSSRGITALYEGRLEDARALLERAMSLYGPDLHPTLAQSFGDESGLLPHFYHFWCLWLLGRPDEAVRKMEEAMRIVQGLPSPYVRVTGFLFEMILWHELRRPAEVHRVAEQFVDLSREQKFPFFLALATCGSGWTLMHRGEPERGIEQIQEALESHRAIGTRLPRAYWLTYLIEVCLSVGKIQEGLAAVEEALTLSETQLDVFYDAELYRLRGELLLKVPDPEGAEAAFRQALGTARQQGALALELRAAASLGRLLRDQERAGEARPVLAGVYGAFREGLTTPDLEEARRLLDELG
jgi:serine/threonine protein kinase/predicted ATPase